MWKMIKAGFPLKVKTTNPNLRSTSFSIASVIVLLRQKYFLRNPESLTFKILRSFLGYQNLTDLKWLINLWGNQFWSWNVRKGAELLNPKIMNCKSDFEELIIPGGPAPRGGAGGGGGAMGSQTNLPFSAQDQRRPPLGAAARRRTLFARRSFPNWSLVSSMFCHHIVTMGACDTIWHRCTLGNWITHSWAPQGTSVV